MRASVAYNLNTKKYEAIEVAPGRPLRPHLKDRSTSRRVIGYGPTKSAAVADLVKKIDFRCFAQVA